MLFAIIIKELLDEKGRIIRRMIDLSKNVFRPSVTLIEPGTHIKTAGLYVCKCVKMVAKITKFPFCAEVPALLEGQNFFY